MKKVKSRLYMQQIRIVGLVLVFLLATVSIANLFFVNTLTHHNQELRMRELDSIVMSIDEKFSAIEQLMRQLIMDRRTSQLVYGLTPGDLTLDKYAALSSTLDFLYTSGNGNYLFSVWFDHTGLVVNNKGLMTHDVFLHSHYLTGVLTEKMIRQASKNKVWMIPGIPVYGQQTYADAKTVGAGTLLALSKTGVSIFAIIKNKPLVDAIQRIINADDTVVFLLNDEGKVLLSVNEDTLDGSTQKNTDALIQAVKKIGYDDYVFDTREKGRFSYVIGCPQNQYGLQKQRMNALLWITATIGMVFIMAFYLILNKAFFQPISSILTRLQVDRTGNNDEYRVIDLVISGMQHQIGDLTSRLDRQEMDSLSSAANNLLFGVSLDEASSRILTEGRKLFVMISVVSEEDDCAQALYHMLTQQYQAKQIVSFPGNLGYIVQLAREACYGEMIAHLRGLTLQASAVGVSRMFGNLSDIREAYMETQNVLNMKRSEAAGQGGVIVYVAGEDPIDERMGLNWNAKDASILISAMVKGDADTAKQLVSEVYRMDQQRTIAQDREISVYLLDLLQMIINTRKLSELHISRLIVEVRRKVLTESMYALTVGAYETTALTVEKNEEDTLVHFVMEYVEAHYTEDIYLKTIAEKANLSYAYVSHCFNKRRGISFVDYLNTYRVEHAKEWLMHSSKSISEIAEQVGFGSVNTFVRNMKKLEGVTPDAYRKMHQEDINLDENEISGR